MARARKTSFRDEENMDPEDASSLEEVRRKLSAAGLPEGEPLRLPDIARRKRPSMVAHALSGMIGSVLAEMLLFPVDTAKLLVQTAAPGEGLGFFATLARIVHEHGVTGLYKGVGTSIIKESVHSMNYWLWHGFLFGRFGNGDTSRTPTHARLALNLVAKQLNWLCTVPFEVIASVNQLSPDSPGFFVTALQLYRQGGVGSFYKGLSLSLILAINPAIMNTLITTILRLLAMAKMASGDDYEDARDHGPAAIGAATAISKIIATVTTYPLIRTKVLVQTNAGNASVSGIWRDILRTEGWQGFYRGVLAMSYKTVAWNTLMMMFKHALGPKRAITPPATPPMGFMRLPMPVMAREPFPADLITVEKLDEILGYLKGESAVPKNDRVHTLESRMDGVSQEVKEIKALLTKLVDSAAPPREPSAPERAKNA